MDVKFVVEKINEIILECGKIAMDFYLKPIQTVLKSDSSIVSQADGEIEKVIEKKLLHLIEGAAIIGEEGAEAGTLEEKNESANRAFESEYVCAVDPVDGTINFASRYGEWGISIGLLKKDTDGHIPYLGAIYMPVKDTLYYTDSEKSYVVYYASRENRVRLELEVRDYTIDERVTDKIFMTNSLMLSKYTFGKFKNIRIPGSTVVPLAATAAGESIGTIAYAHLWDIAAGLAIGKYTGIKMYDLENRERIEELRVEDFRFDSVKNYWKLKGRYLVCSESANGVLFENLVPTTD